MVLLKVKVKTACRSAGRYLRFDELQCLHLVLLDFEHILPFETSVNICTHRGGVTSQKPSNFRVRSVRSEHMHAAYWDRNAIGATCLALFPFWWRHNWNTLSLETPPCPEAPRFIFVSLHEIKTAHAPTGNNNFIQSWNGRLAGWKCKRIHTVTKNSQSGLNEPLVI